MFIWPLFKAVAIIFRWLRAGSEEIDKVSPAEVSVNRPISSHQTPAPEPPKSILGAVTAVLASLAVVTAAFAKLAVSMFPFMTAASWLTGVLMSAASIVSPSDD